MHPKNIIKGIVEEKVCHMHAKGLSATIIARELAKIGVKITQSSVYRYLHKPSSLPNIQKAIEKYRANPLAVDMAHKRSRLEDMNRERLRILDSLGKMCGDKNGKLGEIPVKGWSKYTTLLKRLIELEIAGRDEIEKKPDMVAFFQKIGPLAEVSDEELRKQIADVDVRLLNIRGGKLSQAEDGTPKGDASTNKG